MRSISTVTCLDDLPIELFHKILNYLHTHDIFHSLHNVSAYINTILNNYNRYHLNFQSISMSNFYLTLDRINSDQVISLTLSNMDDTPGQFQLFLRLFSLQQFTRLQSLHLIQPANPIDLNRILAHLHTLDSLQSLAITHCQPSSVNQETFTHLAFFLTNSISLRRLDLSGAFNAIFHYDFITPVRHLYYNDNIFNTVPLQTMISRMPHLKSLDTGITLNMNYDHLPLLLHLTRLTMTIFIRMKQADLQILFGKIPMLTFFKVTADGTQWFDGHFWEQCLPLTVRTFQFNFSTQSVHIHEQMILETFQTSFWLNIKHWYVMLDYQMHPTITHLYSLPYYDTQFYYRPSNASAYPFRSSVSVDRPYMDQVTRLTVDLSTLDVESHSLVQSTHFFSHVSTLILADHGAHFSVQFLLDFLESILDLTQITELKLGQFHHPDFIRILYNRLPRLSSLRITEKMFAQLERLDFHHIRSLTICDCLTDVERMCSMFPKITSLGVRLMTFEHTQRVMELLQDTLINVTFRQMNEELQEQTVKWLSVYCGEHRHFSYDVDQHMNLHIWLSDYVI